MQIVNVPNINEEVVLRNGDSVIYRMEVKNISYDKDLDNVTLSIPLPQGVKVKEVYYTGRYFWN